MGRFGRSGKVHGCGTLRGTGRPGSGRLLSGDLVPRLRHEARLSRSARSRALAVMMIGDDPEQAPAPLSSSYRMGRRGRGPANKIGHHHGRKWSTSCGERGASGRADRRGVMVQYADGDGRPRKSRKFRILREAQLSARQARHRKRIRTSHTGTRSGSSRMLAAGVVEWLRHGMMPRRGSNGGIPLRELRCCDRGLPRLQHR